MKFITKPRENTMQDRSGFTDDDLTTPGHDAIMMWLDDQMTPDQLSAWLQIENGWGDTSSEEEEMTKHIQEYLEQFSSNLDRAISAVEGLRKLIARPALGYDSAYYERDLPAAMAKVKDAQRAVETAQTKIAQLPQIPGYPGLKVTKKEWEMPAMSGTFLIGSIDFVAHYQEPSLAMSYTNDKRLSSWTVTWTDKHAYFEVKTTIRSLGELLRQIGRYREQMKPHTHNGYYVPPAIPWGQLFVVCPDARFATKIKEQGYGFIQAPQV